MQKNKNMDVLDITKFVMSFVIIMIHTDFLHQYIYPAARLAVPVFFLLSGYFAFYKLNRIENPKEKRKTVAKIIKRYLQLYGFWFVVLFPYTLYIRKYFEAGIIRGFGRMIQSFFLGSTFGTSWYLMACVLGILIIYLLSQRFSDKVLLIMAIPVYLFATVLLEFQGYITSNPEYNQIFQKIIAVTGVPYGNFVIALIYIIIGKIASNPTSQFNKKTTYLMATIFSFFLLCLEFFAASKGKWFVYSCDCWIFLAPTAAFLVLYLLNCEVKNSYAPYLRKISTIVYCTHLPICLVIAKMIQLTKIQDPMNLLKFTGTAVLSLFCAVVLLRLEKCCKYKIFRILRYAY